MFLSLLIVDSILLDIPLMPKEEIHDVMYRLILPTTLNLANVFDVTQEFVRERLDEIRQSLPRMIAGYDF